MDDQITLSKRIILDKIGDRKPSVGIVLGSGLGVFAESISDQLAIPYSELPGFPEAGVSGHAGRLRVGNIGETGVAVMQGRAHYYESGSANAMKVAVGTLASLGCDTLILSNAAGSLDPDIGPGSIMLLTDHISFTGVSPLFGVAGDDRFVDLSDAYDLEIRDALKSQADALGITLHEGQAVILRDDANEVPNPPRMFHHVQAADS